MAVKLYLLKFAQNVRSYAAYRFNLVCWMFFGFLQVVLMASVWIALYATNGVDTMNGASLNDMLIYNLFSNLTNGLVGGSGIMYMLDRMIVQGDIANRLLLPLSFPRDLCLSIKVEGLVNTMFALVPVLLVGLLIYRPTLSFAWADVGLYVLSLLLASCISFGMFFLFGLVTFWVEDAYFFSWAIGALNTLFSGYMVPMWFFPGWLNTISRFLPFRYMVFEPMNILLGKNTVAESMQVLGMQALMAVICIGAAMLVWRRAQRRVFVQGG